MTTQSCSRFSLFLPLNDDGTPLAQGRVTLERRWDDWMAFVTSDRGRWECSPTPHGAIDRLRTSHPDVFEERA